MRSLFVDAVDGGTSYIAKSADESRDDVVVNNGWGGIKEEHKSLY